MSELFARVFRMISATHSGRFRPPIPDDFGHPFRLISATDPIDLAIDSN